MTQIGKRPRVLHPGETRVSAGQFRLDLIGRTITYVAFRTDADGQTWTVLSLDTGQDVHILDETPWVWVEAEIM